MTVSCGKNVTCTENINGRRIECPLHVSLLNSSQKASRYATRRQIDSTDGSIAACKLQKSEHHNADFEIHRAKKVNNVIALFLSEPIDNTRERKLRASGPQGKVIQGYLLVQYQYFNNHQVIRIKTIIKYGIFPCGTRWKKILRTN